MAESSVHELARCSVSGLIREWPICAKVAIKRDLCYIKADPVKHKLTLQWPKDSNGPSIRYFNGGVDRRGIRKRFCWTTNRNTAGYFLSFVEVYDSKKGRGERKEFRASKNRTLMKERARRMYRAYANRNKKPKA